MRWGILAIILLGGCLGTQPLGSDGGVVVADGGEGGAGQWYYTCGDPVCRGYTAPAGVARCTTEQAGASCAALDRRCDPVDPCNRLLVCSTKDPTTQPGGCPISRRSAKRDIRYLATRDLERYAAELKRIPLATYRYRWDPPDAAPRLGFVLDDVPGSAAADRERDVVDLYGYASLAAAAIQAQAREIEALRSEVNELRRRIESQLVCEPPPVR